MKKAAYIVAGVLFTSPVYAQHHDHRNDNSQYQTTHEDLTLQGWQTRQRAQDQEELRELRQHQVDEFKRHEDFDRLFPKGDYNGRE